ncbi:MAG: NAD malic enzyme [Monoraphidium minutum]|nr:MAG: NAD malic enzyme [Monoraphidium minutum]
MLAAILEAAPGPAAARAAALLRLAHAAAAATGRLPPRRGAAYTKEREVQPHPNELDEPQRPYDPPMQPPVHICHKLSQDVLQDPTLNKGTAFQMDERERLGLRGLLPPVAVGSGITREMERQWRVLRRLKDRNETLYYRVLLENFVEMAPIVYTPTVGWVCSNYHALWKRPRGMFFTAADRGQMASMVYNWPQLRLVGRGQMASMGYNWPQDDVHAIVVTDGSRILGLGDLGANGLGIPIGKLDLYVAAAGFHPSKVLPCVIDVGTNNERLRADPHYVGLRQPRVKGDAYYEIVDEFVRAVTSRWPRVILQFEDFSTDHALALLHRYQGSHLVFNDDIQGTAATAVSGLYGALRVLGRPKAELARQRVVCLGAGSAGMGVVSMIKTAMETQGLAPEEAQSNFWVLDVNGLITNARGDIPPHVAPFARPEAGLEGLSLLEVVRRVKPTVLLGLSGAGRLFTREVLEAAAAGTPRPIIFSMSNPTSKMECTAEEALAATRGAALFASGSPQDPVDYGGRRREFAQANNLYLFPGLALGAFLGRTGTVSNAMLMAAAEEIPRLISDEDMQLGMVYPRIKAIREISAAVAVAVIKAAAAEGAVRDEGALRRLRQGDERLLGWVQKHMYSPTEYVSLAYRPPGVGE